MKNGKNALYEDLKRQILAMELRPDEVLDETRICEAYGLSRTPVREVFRRLAGEGYVDIRENRGVRVTSMSYGTLRNFFQVAPMIYSAVARLAVQNYTLPQLLDLKETQARLRAASQQSDTVGLVLENNRFHAIMGEMADNPYLTPSLQRLLIDHARIGHTFYRPHNQEMQESMEQSSAHHDAFIEALEQRDEPRMVTLVHEHWELSRQNLQMFIAPPSIRADLNA
ncbi:hypothetical protein ALO41_00147 [Pseudomonas amygdali pv. ulmi]|uniref:HTH gntR-type domain-containing protein n=1 Tax=Pseudomonas amygdali pv. ulmi TaxID=251720 RepID=A0A0N8TCA1_PSEA0|nr:GntR family transcriptional regulator [Pseudomonas amygdali]KPZ10217.1 hypothetical protein ALO41_00147 [Pseudomonas amygdali pv. ulmi]KWS23056.1 GntR family transcriptional regulator [Pseudomonas amygdali pv. ulmi]RMR24716.1 hypothetical protein ALP90_01998 [Pseudomonas amygdali pv. ulmi]